jgi:hypothetical protein
MPKDNLIRLPTDRNGRDTSLLALVNSTSRYLRETADLHDSLLSAGAAGRFRDDARYGERFAA